LITHGITARNNLIRGYGQIEGSAIGIWIGAAADNQILHNEIADGFYTAISVGWIWGYAKSRATGNKINFNYLHHIGKGVLSDLGAVYTLGISPGTTVNNNRIHDIYCFGRYGDGASGLYTDEGSSNILFANNLVYKVHKGAIHQHYGENNTFRNNIFAYSDFGVVRRSRDEDHLSFTLENNIFVWDKSPLFYRSWNRPSAYILKNNLYWFDGDPITEEDKEQKFFVGKTFADWQKSGMDQGSLWGDPGFVDSKNYDFHFKGGSPNEKVRAIGFQPFDFDLSGVEKEIREGWGKRYSDYRFPDLITAPDPPLPAPLSLKEDFEKPRFNPLPQATTPDKPFKQTCKIRISPVQADGTAGKPILSDNKAVMAQAIWNRLDWFGFCANGTVEASIDLDNIKVEGTKKDQIPFLLTEDFGKVRSLPVPNTRMSPLQDKKAWSILSEQGNKYLRIHDGRHFRAAYDPHFYYKFKDLIGKTRISYDVRLSQNAFLYSEAREYNTPAKYLSGPTISFKAGKITLPLKESIPYQADQWYRVEWEFDQDQGAFPPYEIREEKGNHFVRLNDDPRFPHTFSPFFHYNPNYLEGPVDISFKVRLSKEANLVLEGRNLENPYKIGPNIILKEGKIIVRGKAVCDFPEDRWIALSLKWDLGPNAPKTWNLRVFLCNPDGSIEKSILKDQKFALVSKEITSLNEFYFIGAGTKKATIDLDDIQIHQ
ncbi:MAG: right-handed parallel beta-helix repeat-containing protein, partial [Planctomycetia bacterium]|nr:right-handed parallel beta-helix repeat-containing protein [Planctomycetia bacterium]